MVVEKSVVVMNQWHMMSNSDIVEVEQPFVVPGDNVLEPVIAHGLELGMAQSEYEDLRI